MQGYRILQPDDRLLPNWYTDTVNRCIGKYTTHPIYREMVIKQRVLFDQMHRYHYIDTSVDKACQEAIRMMDENDMEIKRLRQAHHAKFLKIPFSG